MNSGRAGRAAGAPLALGVRLAVLVLLLCSCGPPAATGQAESLDIEQIAQRDLYAVLELEPGAAAFDVKAAYRKLAKKWHPDKNPDDTQTAQSKFAEIAEAYEVLSDDSSRQLYDHARRVRAAHEHANSDNNREHSGGRGRGGGGGGGVWEMDPEWFYADGGDWDGFGSSFGGSAAFSGAPYGGGWGGASGGGAFEFRARDPMELFEALFGAGSFDGPDSDYYYAQDAYDYQQQQQQQQQYPHQQHQQQQHQQQQQQRQQQQYQQQQHQYQQQQQQQQQQQEEMSWGGQDFEQYQDYEDGGQMFRRVITTVMYGDGSSRSTAQDFLFDKSLDAWFEKTGPFDYYGPGVAPIGERRFGHGNVRGDTPVDNVLRMNEFLRVGHSIASVDRKFTAVLESDCNLVVYHLRGGGKKVWETSSFSPEGRCFVAIQDNGMLVVMAGNDPSAPGNVLWSNNQAHVGWFRQNSFHAAVLPSGNLVVSQGDSPMHPAARRCVWGAFGCPGDGGVMEWKLVWMSFRTKAGDIWCKVKGCDGAGENSHYSDSGENPGGNETRDSSSWKWQSGGGGGAGVDGGAFDPWAAGRGGGREDDGGGGGGGGGISHLLTQPGAAIKKAAGRGVAWLTEALTKIKSAAEDSAYAASRPRHW